MRIQKTFIALGLVVSITSCSDKHCDTVVLHQNNTSAKTVFNFDFEQGVNNFRKYIRLPVGRKLINVKDNKTNTFSPVFMYRGKHNEFPQIDGKSYIGNDSYFLGFHGKPTVKRFRYNNCMLQKELVIKDAIKANSSKLEFDYYKQKNKGNVISNFKIDIYKAIDPKTPLKTLSQLHYLTPYISISPSSTNSKWKTFSKTISKELPKGVYYLIITQTGHLSAIDNIKMEKF